MMGWLVSINWFWRACCHWTRLRVH